MSEPLHNPNESWQFDRSMSPALYLRVTKSLGLNRASAARYFGVQTYAAHVNGLVRRGDDVEMWIARRSPTKSIDPGRLESRRELLRRNQTSQEQRCADEEDKADGHLRNDQRAAQTAARARFAAST